MERTRGLRFSAIIALIFILVTIIVSPIVAAAPATVKAMAPTETVVAIEEKKIEKTLEERMLEQIQDVVYVEPKTSEEAFLLSEAAIKYKINLYKALPPEGTPEYEVAYAILEPEIYRMVVMNEKYCHKYTELGRWEKRMKEYPVATKVWLYMRDVLGWNEYVCAGVMGNMMAECGGQTLNLNVYAKNSSSGCYGICQWHPRWNKEVQGADLDVQLEYLGKHVEAEFNDWAGNAFNFHYDDFLAIEDCAVAAKKFCIVYERPGGYDTQRSRNAQRAYEYFVD